MVFSMVKLVDLKRKKSQTKLQHTKRQVFHHCLAIFNRVIRFRKTQGRNQRSPRCTEFNLSVDLQPEEICKKREKSRETRTEPTSHDNPQEKLLKKQEKNRENPNWIIVPDDIVEDILHRLPVKYLVRLKSVSKEWKSLIESWYLAEKHVRLHEKNHGDQQEEIKINVEWSNTSSFCVKYYNLSRLGPNNEASESVIRVPGSCNGLVCVYDLVFVYVFNPVTRVTRTLTPPLGTKLALESTLLSVGFGKDVVTGKYKVAAFYSSGIDTIIDQTVVFDVCNGGRWRRRYKTAGPIPLSCISPISNDVVFVNGSLFWFLARNHTEILAMDLHTDNVQARCNALILLVRLRNLSFP
ncbi:unnamed protein product [Cochlearia groenlandica]